MTKVIHYIWWLGILCWSLSACSDDKLLDEKGWVEVKLSLTTDMSTRASSDIGVATHSVDRILVLPFQKVNLSLPDTQNDNFIPVWSLARQYNIPAFPSTNLSFTLENSKTYKILVIGYNHADYDHNNPSGSGNRVILSSQPLPTTLANFQLYPKLPNQVPEFFICYGIASKGSTTLGPVFVPDDGITLSGTLGRIVSGLGVKITNIPSYVNSVTLLADNMVKAIRVADTTIAVMQTAGDNESRVIRQQNVVNGTVDFGIFLLPSGKTNTLTFYLDIGLGSLTQRYTMYIEDSDVTQGGKLMLLPNDAVIISAGYDKINYGFVITRDINLEDDVWDGINPTP